MADLIPLILTDLLETFLTFLFLLRGMKEFSNGPMDERRMK